MMRAISRSRALVLVLFFLLTVCGQNYVHAKRLRVSLINNCNYFLYQQDPQQILATLESAFENMKTEMEKIIAVKRIPTFKNTMIAFDLASEKFQDILSLYTQIALNHKTPAMSEIEASVGALEAESEVLMLNPKFIIRVKEVSEKLKSNTEKKLTALRLLESLENRAGGTEIVQQAVKAINEQIQKLSTQFSNQHQVRSYAIHVRIPAIQSLGGLQPLTLNNLEEYREADGSYRVPLSNLILASGILREADSTELRKKFYYAGFPKEVASKYISAEEAGEFWTLSNDEIIKRIAFYRAKKAELLGYKTYADYALKGTMAKDLQTVQEFYKKLLPPVLNKAKAELQELEVFANKLKPGLGKLSPWDVGYYSLKLKNKTYGLDFSVLDEYFELNHTLESTLQFYGDLYTLRFQLKADQISYHPDTLTYEVFDKLNGQRIGEILFDLYQRESKNIGAWKLTIQPRGLSSTGQQLPIIGVSMNLNQHNANPATLLTLGEVEILFHELGHGMHKLFSNLKYRFYSGTNVSTDFVEFPSQIMENWVTTDYFIKKYAKHYITGEPLDPNLIGKLQEANQFQVGMTTLGQIRLGVLDLAWHSIEAKPMQSVIDFEKQVLAPFTLFKNLEFKPISGQFSHIFEGGYEAQYYSYTWSDLLAADGYNFWSADPLQIYKRANQFRKQVLSQGGLRSGDELFKAWVGRELNSDAYLKRSGIQ